MALTGNHVEGDPEHPGDHNLIDAALGQRLVKASNLADLADVPTAKGNLSLVKADVGLSNVENAAASGLYLPLTEKGTDSGVASLDGSGQVPLGQLGNAPSGGGSGVTYGTTSGTAAEGDDSRIVGAAQKSANLSDVANKATARSNLGLGTAATHATGDYDAAGAAAAVTKSSLGLGNVDNTADTAKPVSTAQATAHGLLAPKASPTFTGTVTVPAVSGTSDSSTKAAPTAFVQAVAAAATAGMVTGTGVDAVVKITSAAYGALGTPDASTLYVIVG